MSKFNIYIYILMLAIEKFIGIYKNIDTFKEKTLFRIIKSLDISLI